MLARRVKRDLKGISLAAVLLLASVVCTLALTPVAHAYPDAEIVWAFGGGPPFNFGVTSTISGFVLMSDAEIALSYGKVPKLIDAGSYAAESEQPFDISTDDDTNSVITSIGYESSSGKLLAAQQDGTLLLFPLSDVTSKPGFVLIQDGSELGPMAVDTSTGYAYVSDNTSMNIHVVDTVSLTVLKSFPLTITGSSSFLIMDAHYVPQTGEVYFTTDVGGVFYVSSAATQAVLIDVDITGGAILSGIDQLPGGSKLYVVDTSNLVARKIDTSSHTVDSTTIDLSANSSLSDIAITQVTNPAGTYAYVAGADGLSVINTGSDTVIDFGTDPAVDGEPMPTSAQPIVLQASSVDDGFVYAIFSTGEFGVISENPFVAISSVVYSNGGSTLGQGESFTITFTANQAGIYEVRAGGSVDASGIVLTDNAGATSGAIDADTAISATFNYDDNADAFSEGTNAVWVFVTNGDLRGRRASDVTVDTPPPDVVISSTGFGTGKVYVNFERIDVEDMATYNVYADTDPDAVLTKTDVSVAVAQPASGSSVTGEVTGLTNGSLYYFAMEAVDANGNTSPNRTSTYADGTRVTGTPQETEGPAGASGEKGCHFARHNPSSPSPFSWLAMFVAIAVLGVARKFRSCALAVLLVVLLIPAVALAQDEEGVEIEVRDIPTGWELIKDQPSKVTLEAKTGFWMPTSSALEPFYGKCCNMWTRFQVGYMFEQKYGFEFGVGFHYNSGKAVGTSSGTTAQESYSFLLVPMEVSGVWRADYFPNWRIIIPYLKAGFDGVIFRESTAGNSVKGIKWGAHGTGGLQFNLGMIGDARQSMGDIGIKDFFLTLEAEYMWVNSFGKSGLDLSGPIFSIGFLFYL
jgi:hypothetical protein